MSVFFFFQAEDGIRDIGVTGVQTCALPIFEVPDSSTTDIEATEDLARFTLAARLPQGSSVRLIKFLSYGWSSRRSAAALQIGRASCRERGEISVVAVSLKTKKHYI